MENIYQQYLTYYNDINTKIHTIDGLPYIMRSKPNVILDRAALINFQKQLYTMYLSSTSVDQYVQSAASTINQVEAAYDDALSLYALQTLI